VRRLLVVNALIFAVLAAAVALAYYGYSFVTSEASREREENAMGIVAEEKVFAIEDAIIKSDKAVFESPLPLEQFIDKLREIANSTGGAYIQSVFVLDDKLKLIPGGYVSDPSTRPDKEGVEFRDWFITNVVPDLPLTTLAVDRRQHLHRKWDRQGQRKPFLFSFVKRVSGDKTFYVVIEEHLTNLVAFTFPQSFPRLDLERSKLVYQVIDSGDGDPPMVVHGLEFFEPPEGALTVTVPFTETMDMWSVRISESSADVARVIKKKRLIDSLFIGGSVAVMLAGLLVLVLAIRRERRANELKSEFISNVSHELKTPLSIISMFGEMLANGRTKGPEQSTEYAEIIWRESVRLGRLIDNVLDFAKIDRGKGVYEFVETDVGEVVDRAVDLVGRRLTMAEMTIDVEIEPELPLVKLDANAFTLAVMNLIDNATKYAADGKRIKLELKRQGDRIVLSVQDWGQGIDVQEQEQIFERFYRARAVRLKQIRGSGIGLALVRHIARAHHGDVSVESTPGGGSTFRIWLPVPD
jgi:two-component system, OmpR family, phosphate regulon sensor histidine kinase PhoR